ncbi:hypothetical protein [Maridesulfovibrio bastinii]|uniref:hypothetical protein n=1 Tax=Maridesulfovibrio bastinii TaxID=47157 RepID=UPI0012EC40F6|nr:hypothetical protein [Maridesulfovibrio bastinii]
MTGLISTTVLLFAGYDFFHGRRARMRRSMNIAKKNKGRHRAAFIVDLLSQSNLLNSFNKNKSKLDLDNIDDVMIFHYNWNKGRNIEQKDVSDILCALDKEYQEIENQSPDVLYLFYGGPVTLNAYIGSLLANRMLTHVYHYSAGEYEYWYSLNIKK